MGWRVFYRVVVVPLEAVRQVTQLCDNLKVQGVARFIRATWGADSGVLPRGRALACAPE